MDAAILKQLHYRPMTVPELQYYLQIKNDILIYRSLTRLERQKKVYQYRVRHGRGRPRTYWEKLPPSPYHDVEMP